MELPGRDEVVDRLGQMIAAASRRRVGSEKAPNHTCVLLLVEIEEYGSLVELDESGGRDVDEEICRRLDRQVRSNDGIGRTAPDRYVVVFAGVSPAVVGTLVERVRTAFAMPLALGDGLVSLPVRIAVELAERPRSRVQPEAAVELAAVVMDKAEAQLSPR